MRRPITRRKQTGLSLFPFLAVLICTMGSLIVLLLLVVQQAAVQAEMIRNQREPSTEAAEKDSQQVELEDQDWRREILEQQRAQQLEELSRHRLELSHLEEHIRSLEDEARRLAEALAQLNRVDTASEQDVAAAQSELAAVNAAIDQQRRRLDEARQKAAGRPPAFAIVPYQGPNGTQRRPIYVECTAAGIVLQPEGIIIGAADLSGELGPGNPLDAALRAVREYLAASGGVQRHGEPYPLLIVRPDGAESYGMARAAMSSWDDEFGYELVEADLKLAYPPADAELANILKRAIEDARQRQAILAAAMPSRFKDSGGMDGYVATSRRGGFVRVGGDSDHEGLGGGQGAKGGGGQSSGRRDGATGRPPSAQAENSSPPDGDVEAQQRGGAPGGNQSMGSARNAGGGPGASMAAGMQSLAESRGEGFGLPNKTAGATGITRPIRVVCEPHQLVIAPYDGEPGRARITQLNGPMRSQIDHFISDVWEHMEGWGIAVAGGYWQPVLRVEVAPGAEQRYVELESLLRDSGLDVRRRSP